ncbi:Glycosyl transferases group 1 [Gimesia panareensis]|uniref:Glycosyl transferases group 1 n=1 Tax=Gimesia panareensis TaxID=2527978 RepID=A0A518FL68_9PLAN|nr:glycosyltransferase [Gimesia panareensis]QDV17104.1 Glycosyl transferases group 1 [Gimesia panareensis]
MIESLCVIGHPSRLGGADTELDHQIRCWLSMGIEVHLCPVFALDNNQKSMGFEEMGCIYHEHCDWASLEGMHCISFCNAEFLKYLPEIKKYSRTTTFVNCMSWNFELEIEHQKQNLIDFHLYQTEHSYQQVSKNLKEHGIYRPLFFQPYFHAEEFPFIDNRPTDKFRFGRISRDDSGKFGSEQLWIYETMTAPVLKEGLILGWGANTESKLGTKPPQYIQAIPEGGLTQRAFYAQCEAIIMTTDTFENLPRVGFEAMSSGSILIVDDRGGWQLEIEDGVTGWLCKDHREFVYKASRCAFEKEERNIMRKAARERLEKYWGLQSAMDSWAQVFEQWEKYDIDAFEQKDALTAL